MEIQQLRHFIKVCEYMSFSRAAKSCFISIQGISMSISRLETEIECSLFLKSSRGIELTAQAQYLLPKALEIVNAVDECEEYFASCKSADKSLNVIFSIGAIEDFSYIPLQKYMQQYKDITVNITEIPDLECEEAMLNGKAEIAIMGMCSNLQKFETECVFTAKRMLIVNKDHPLAKKDEVEIEDLAYYSIIFLRSAIRYAELIKKACFEKGFEIDYGLQTENILSLYRLVEISDAVGLSNEVVHKRLARSSIKAIPFKSDDFDRKLYIVTADESKLSNQAKIFKKMVMEYVVMLLNNPELR